MNDYAWVDRSEYPFETCSFNTGAGQMHYVDVGQGPPLLMLHGTPEWSFSYRHLIRCLSARFRCIAPDYLGFGLSEKPAGWSYRPEDHSRIIGALVEHLNLRDVTLMAHDFGGPIGLGYVIQQPERFRRLVLFNTWLWSLRGDSHYEGTRLLAGRLGRFLYQRLDFSLRFLFKSAFARKERLTPAIYRQYEQVFTSPQERYGTWVLARELLGSSDWYESLWQQRSKIAHLPMLILWGMKDLAFRAAELEKWQQGFPKAQVIRLPETGHSVMEEAREALCPVLLDFLDSNGR